MSYEGKIEAICIFYDCDFINRFYKYCFDSFDPEDMLSPVKFEHLMKEYKISKKELVSKGVDISNLKHSEDKQGLFDFQVRKQIDKIGKSENKNKKGKSYSYVRNPGTLHKKALLELFRDALPIPAPPYVSLQNALTLSRGSTIVQFLQEKQIIDNDIFSFESIEKLKESLRNLSELELCELLNLLQSNNSVEYENLLLLQKIFQIDELQIEDIESIYILFEYLKGHPELNTDKLQYALSKRQKGYNDEIAKTLFLDSVSNIDEQTLR